MVLKKKRKLGVVFRVSDYREFIFVLIFENLFYEVKELGKMVVDGNFSVDDDVLNVLIGSMLVVDFCLVVLFFKFMVGKERRLIFFVLRNLSRNLYKYDKLDDMLDVFYILFFKDYFINLENYGVMFFSMCEVGRVR